MLHSLFEQGADFLSGHAGEQGFTRLDNSFFRGGVHPDRDIPALPLQQPAEICINGCIYTVSQAVKEIYGIRYVQKNCCILEFVMLLWVSNIYHIIILIQVFTG